jgi:hypothetical protein
LFVPNSHFFQAKLSKLGIAHPGGSRCKN